MFAPTRGEPVSRSSTRPRTVAWAATVCGAIASVTKSPARAVARTRTRLAQFGDTIVITTPLQNQDRSGNAAWRLHLRDSAQYIVSPPSRVPGRGCFVAGSRISGDAQRMLLSSCSMAEPPTMLRGTVPSFPTPRKRQTMRFRLQRALLVGGVVAAFASPLAAQQAVLTGRVTSDRGDPLGGANVTVANSDSRGIASESGTYSLTLTG